MRGTNSPEDAPRTIRDEVAGQLLRSLRENLGLSREELPFAMIQAGVPRRNVPCTKTIYNVEVHGQIPRVRLKFGFATFYERGTEAIWDSRLTARRAA